VKRLGQIIKRLELRKAKLKTAAAEVSGQLQRIGALKIYLFGSFVTGRITPSSDLDFLAVMPKAKTSKQWLSQVYREIKRPVACDIFVYNALDFENYREKSALLRGITRKGRLIYEKRN